MDVKYDDGFPMRGKILGHNALGQTAPDACITSFVPSTATYVIDNTRCNIYFEAGF